MASEFDQAYGFIVKSCNYLGTIQSLKGEIEAWEAKERDILYLVDKKYEKLLSRKKQEDPDWYKNSKNMLYSIIENNSLIPAILYYY